MLRVEDLMSWVNLTSAARSRQRYHAVSPGLVPAVWNHGHVPLPLLNAAESKILIPILFKKTS